MSRLLGARLVLGALLLAGVTACAAPSPGLSPGPTSSPITSSPITSSPIPSSPGLSPGPTSSPVPSSPGALTFAAVGDSITVGNSADFNGLDVGDSSWVYHARSSRLVHTGGWAANGATTADMRANVRPVDADVLVVMAGTNDVLYGIPFDESARNIEAIVDTVGVKRVIISAIGPMDFAPEKATAFNSLLRGLAASRGWEWADPMAAVRDGERFVEGYASDGLHPSVPASRFIGEALREAFLGDRG